MSVVTQKSTESSEQAKRPPAQPTYVLRGHSAQIHALCFFRQNRQLISADADGWIVIWDVALRRPAGVWRAHHGAILGLAAWGHDRIISHGRDNKLYVWSLNTASEHILDKTLPVDDEQTRRPEPWLLHALYVNTLNFCSFKVCHVQDESNSPKDASQGILVAVPNLLDSDSVDVFHLPSEDRVHTIPADKTIKTGMIMALGLFYTTDGLLTLSAGYESGHALVFQHSSMTNQWRAIYKAQPHTQPVLSLDVDLSREAFFTSSADAIIAKHPVPASSSTSIDTTEPLKIVQTKHAGQQGLSIRLDGKLFATAGWDARIRVYSTKTMKELAVLRWHKEGCYAVAFAAIGEHLSFKADSSHGLDQNDPKEMLDLIPVIRAEGTVTRAVEQRRIDKASSTHWIAAGSKDGKVSLWDIY